MKKRIIILTILIIIIIIIIFSIIFLNPNLTGRSIENQENTENLYTYTKAICNNTNFCQDNEITCKGEETISVSPISGAAVQFSEDWQDPRDKETIGKLC